MSIALTEDQEELRRVVRRFLEDKSSPAAVRETIDSEKGFDPKLWGQMAGELGLPALHIPETFGGQGFSFVELAVVFEEVGRALAVAPLFSSVALAANALLAAGTEEQQARYLPGIAAGEVLATAAITDPAPAVTSDGTTLSGEVSFVVDAMTADLLVVPAGDALYVLEAAAAGLERRSLPILDLTRPQGVVTLRDVPAERLGHGAPATTARALDYAGICLAAEMAGGARRCLEAAVAYAKERVQFGVPIGSFQAIKHQLAELLMLVEQAAAVAYHAALAAAEEDPELSLAASIAQAWCSDAYTEVATENIQIHGGVAFTWEHDAHLYFRRARASEVMLGDATIHRQRIARLLLD
ncbi:MAG: acyl-CoA dehydrogenase family protein [Acidimicrobiia bacterium]